MYLVFFISLLFILILCINFTSPQMKWTRVLLVAALIAFSQAQNVAQQVCTSSSMMVENAVSDASIILGGLFDLRLKGTYGLGCGALDSGKI
jgi:hypothetical protein